MNVGGVVPTAEREGGELQRRGPAFGPRLEGVHVRIGELEGQGGAEVRRCLLGGEPKVRGAHLDELSAGRRRPSGTGGSERAAITRCICGGEVVDEERDGIVNVGRLDQVVVVEDQRDI